jgi:hypothetical protein
MGAKLTRTQWEQGSCWSQEGSAMAEQFENPEVTKLEDETVSDATAKKRIERVAERLAEKASHTEQNYDQGSNDLFKVK